MSVQHFCHGEPCWCQTMWPIGLCGRGLVPRVSLFGAGEFHSHVADDDVMMYIP